MTSLLSMKAFFQSAGAAAWLRFRRQLLLATRQSKEYANRVQARQETCWPEPPGLS